MCVIRGSVFGTEPQSPPCCSVDGHCQRWLHLRPYREWKMTIGHAPVCQAWPQDMSSHATASSYPTHTQIPANHLHVLVCYGATSVEHPSSGLHPWLVFLFFFLLDYRCQQSARTPVGTEKRRGFWLGAHYVVRHSPWHARSRSRHGTATLIKNSSLSLHAFFCKNLHSLF